MFQKVHFQSFIKTNSSHWKTKGELQKCYTKDLYSWYCTFEHPRFNTFYICLLKVITRFANNRVAPVKLRRNTFNLVKVQSQHQYNYFRLSCYNILIKIRVQKRKLLFYNICMFFLDRVGISWSSRLFFQTQNIWLKILCAKYIFFF